MSRETLLDEAIIKAKESEDWQLVEWLRAARGAESAARWYSDKLREAHRTERKLLQESAELRELVRISIEFCADGMCGIYEGCPLNAADGRCRFDDRARELGIEVDG